MIVVLIHAGICDASIVEKLVLLDAPLMDHDFSPEFMDYVEEEERLRDAGEA